jgi:hypothetical protein
MPPAAITPRFTAAASAGTFRLQLFSSLHELAIPITGLPRKKVSDQPNERKTARLCGPISSRPSNHSALRNLTVTMMIPLRRGGMWPGEMRPGGTWPGGM